MGIELEPQDGTGVFEGVIPDAKLPLAYELEVRYPAGETVHPARPVLVPADGRRARPAPRRRGTARGALRAVSARMSASWTASPGSASRCGRRTHARSAWSATSTAGTDASTRCARSARPGSGSSSCPDVAPGARYKFEIRGPDGRLRLKADPLAFRTEVPPKNASIVHRTAHEWRDDDWLERRRAARRAHEPGLDLRGAPRLVAAEPPPGQPAAHVRRARRRARGVRRPTWASRTSSSCR